MKQKKDRFKDYIKKYLISNEEEFKNLLTYKNLKKNNQSYKYLTNKIYSLRFILDPKYVDKLLCDQFTEAYRVEDFETCYEVLTYIYKFYYFEIDLKYSDFPTKLYRTFMVPFRNNMLELIITIEVLLRASGTHLANITIDNLELITGAEKVDDLLEFKDTVDFAEKYPSYLLLEKKNGKFYYDYADGYEFSLSARRPVPVADTVSKNNFLSIDIKGYGIYEDNRSVLNEYLRQPNGYNSYERRLVKDMIPFDFELTNEDAMILRFDNEFKRILQMYSFDSKDSEVQ